MAEIGRQLRKVARAAGPEWSASRGLWQFQAGLLVADYAERAVSELAYYAAFFLGASVVAEPADDRLLEILRSTIVGLVQRKVDLTSRQMGALLICQLEAGPHTIGELAARLGIPKAAITRATDRLEAAGLLRRVQDRHGRPIVLITTTAAGTEFVAHLQRQLRKAARAAGIE